MFLQLLPVWVMWLLLYYEETTFCMAARYQKHPGYIGPLNDTIFNKECPKLTSYTYINSSSSCLALCDMHETCTAAYLHDHDTSTYCELLKCPYPIPTPTPFIGYTSYYKESGYFGPTALIWGEADCLPIFTFTRTTTEQDCFLKCTDLPHCTAVTYNPGRSTCTMLECPYPIPEPTRNFQQYMGFYKEPGYFGPLSNSWSDSDCETIYQYYPSGSVEECKATCDNRPGCTTINYGRQHGKGTCILKECPLPVPQPTGNMYNTVGYYKFPGCLSSQFECDSGQCISKQYKCNVIEHCDDGSDEKYCVCEKHKFECHNAVCVAIHMHCDGNDDCGDGSDERDCGCPQPQFECDNHVCIDDYMICDGNDDCGDGSDEKDCRCPAKALQCRNGVCIKSYMRCDGNDDCGDGSDERYCVCDKNRFQCNNTVCIKNYMKCNGNDDCGDGSDEINCGCPVDWFQCKNTVCIEKHLLCNGNDDCGDGSDEKHCGKCDPKYFTCRKDKQCISQNKVCDLYTDCLDHSDEEEVCNGLPDWCPEDFKWFRNACFRVLDDATSWSRAESNCRSCGGMLMQQMDVDGLINLREYMHYLTQGSTYELWIDKRIGDHRNVCQYLTKYSIRYGYCRKPRSYVCLMAV